MKEKDRLTPSTPCTPRDGSSGWRPSGIHDGTLQRSCPGLKMAKSDQDQLKGSILSKEGQGETLTSDPPELNACDNTYVESRISNRSGQVR
jgi:hypothetical protein